MTKRIKPHPWSNEKPPHKEWVEIIVKQTSKIHTARAIWGDRDKGVLPHWETQDEGILYHPDNISGWRKINE